MKNSFKQKNKGFTLVETLVAVSIFTMSILAMLVVLSQSIANTGYAKRKIFASYLAQEGVEYMRSMRDTFVLYDSGGTSVGWTSFNSKLTAASCFTTGCYFDPADISYTDNSQPMALQLDMFSCSGSCPALRYDETTGKYGYASGTTSVFSRKITATATSANETLVTSTVTWTQGSGSYSIVFSESLFNWVE